MKRAVLLSAIIALCHSVAVAQETGLNWENIEQRIEAEAANGLAGALLVARDGEIVFEKGFGQANREQGIDCSAETVFAIGSMPIDFTHASVLQLAEQGKLSLDDRITKYFDNVPDDKQSITIEHLRTSRSGLRDFHDIPGDANPDHTWIDRDEAVRRIMEQKLLFAPGEGRRHSHSAWGLLAAIVEIASGQSYQDYTREHLYKPAGMDSTGFFGDEYPLERLAVGYGRRSNEKVNSPDNWGPTSWLVMGSGGQVSTVGDMYRFIRALHDGKLLGEDSLKKYFAGGMGLAAAGDMFGFELLYTQRPDNCFFLISNSINDGEDREQFRQLGTDLNDLINGGPRRFSLGIAMNIDDDGISLNEVVAGGAAEAGGLQAGDLLISANGKSLSDEPLDVLLPYLQKGGKITFEIERDGQRMQVEVTPAPVDR